MVPVSSLDGFPAVAAALDSTVFVSFHDRGGGEVVVHKLSPLHDVVRVKLGGGVEVRNDGDGDETGRGELGTTHRVGLGPPNTVTVHWVQDTLQTK